MALLVTCWLSKVHTAYESPSGLAQPKVRCLDNVKLICSRLRPLYRVGRAVPADILKHLAQQEIENGTKGSCNQEGSNECSRRGPEVLQIFVCARLFGESEQLIKLQVGPSKGVRIYCRCRLRFVSHRRVFGGPPICREERSQLHYRVHNITPLMAFKTRVFGCVHLRSICDEVQRQIGFQASRVQGPDSCRPFSQRGS